MADTSEAKVCYVCQNSYDNPKLLPCVHSFCKKCLQDIGTNTDKNSGDTMPCPICGKGFPIPAEGFDGLQTDFFLSRLTRVALEDLWCASCMEKKKESAKTDGSLAVVWCTECRLEVRDCELHPQVKLNLYCTDCEKVLCNMCFFENHQNHKLQSTEHAAANFYNEFKNRPLSGINSETFRRLEEFKQGKLELGGVAECLRENVQKRRQDIEELLDKHVKSLVQDIDSEELRLLGEYESISKDYELHHTCLVSFEVYCREIMTRGSPDDICCAMTNLNGRSEELVTMHKCLNRFKTPQYSLEFRKSDVEELFSCDDFNIIGSIPIFGRKRPTQENRKEQIERLNDRVGELNKQLRETMKENRKLEADVEKLKQDLAHHQSSIEADVSEREERSRIEIESLKEQLEQMYDEGTRHQFLNENLTRRIGKLESEQNMETGRLSHEISGLKQLISSGSNLRERHRYYIDKKFSGQIMDTRSAEIDVRVTGLAILEGELFITTSGSGVVEIRDLAHVQTLKRRVKLSDMLDPYDICSCSVKRCLYIMDKRSRSILCIDKTGNTVVAWPTDECIGTLSVAKDYSVILILQHDNKLREYDSGRGVIQEIELFKYGIDWPWHAVKLNSFHYAIGHGDYGHRPQRVCIADIEKGFTIRSFGEDLGWQMDREITPRYLARDAAGYIMVADGNSNSVFLLTPYLEFEKAVIEHGDYCNRPEARLLAERFCLDEGRSLIVASNFKEKGIGPGSVQYFPLLIRLDTVTT